jgi:hypothetical protein
MRTLALLVLAGLVIAASAAAQTTPAAAQTNFGRPGGPFRVEWELGRSKTGAPQISGYVYNEYGRPVNRVQLLVEALDGADRVLAQRYQWLPGTLDAFGRGYFEVDRLPAAERYRVTVHAYNILDPLRDNPFR